MKYPSIAFISFLFAAAITAADAKTARLDPDRLGWSEVQFRASVLFFSVDANIVLRPLAVTDVTDQLMEPGEGAAIVADESVQQLVFTTDFIGRHTTAELLVNAGTGAALQRTSHDSGNRFRHRIYRFTDIGAYQRTRWPVGKDEEKLATDRWPEWSEAGEDLRPYPDAAMGEIVTDPGGLLYIVGAAQLAEPGDEIEILAYVRGHVHRVQIEVTQPETISIDYRERAGEASVERKGKQQAITLMIRGEGLDDGDDKDEFELLGLRGDIRMHMDPKTRAPLQLKGRVKIAGNVTMRIKELVLRQASIYNP